MAYEICSQSLRTVGARSLAKSGVVGDSLSSRKSCGPPVSVDFRSGKFWQEGMQGSLQLVRPRSVRTRASAVHAAVHAPPESSGFFSAFPTTEGVLLEKPCSHQSAGIGSGVLESWLERSVTEIVTHLPEAPFLQCVFKSGNLVGDSGRQRVSEELFVRPETWGSVKDCLLESAPDGIILVHRLDQNALSECCMNDNHHGIGEEARSSFSLQPGGCSTDVWGVLVHGCSIRCNACYILKTTQVASSNGILTQFCLSRAQCFGPSLKSQLQSTWLL